MNVPSDIEIAQAATPRPIPDVARELGLSDADWEPYGRRIGKLTREATARLCAAPPRGKLVLVTAMSPTPAGEGKTTVSVGLADGLRKIGRQAMVCLREPSLGPCFGMKGGAAGGGYAQVIPMEEINLHFTGDFHAIGLANNLLCAALDNHLHHGNALGIDPATVDFPRVVDMNDRALRHVKIALGPGKNGVERDDQYQITVASEVMACLCLCSSLADLKARLGRIVVAKNAAGDAVTAEDLKVDGAMAALMKDAVRPNLVQTLEGTPAFIHGGPFANIAHGANSVLATRAALGLAEMVVTEAGFGSDLGAEKFMDIVARAGGFKPGAAVVVATLRAVKHQGGGDLEKGFANLARHIRNMRAFGLPVVVALNRFVADSPAEHAALGRLVDAEGAVLALCDVWAKGGEGGRALAEEVAAALDAGGAKPRALYALELPLQDKIEAVAREVYGARAIVFTDGARNQLEALQWGPGAGLPVCIAKTQYSFSADPKLLGAPEGFDLPVRRLRLAAGAGFVIVYCGGIMTMPGLPKVPAAERIDVDAEGVISGLF